jgi:hypothetical protein
MLDGPDHGHADWKSSYVRSIPRASRRALPDDHNEANCFRAHPLGEPSCGFDLSAGRCCRWAPWSSWQRVHKRQARLQRRRPHLRLTARVPIVGHIKLQSRVTQQVRPASPRRARLGPLIESVTPVALGPLAVSTLRLRAGRAARVVLVTYRARVAQAVMVIAARIRQAERPVGVTSEKMPEAATCE